VQINIDVDSQGRLVVEMKARGDQKFESNRSAQYDVTTGELTSFQGPDCVNKQVLGLNKATMILSGISIPPIGSFPLWLPKNLQTTGRT